MQSNRVRIRHRRNGNLRTAVPLYCNGKLARLAPLWLPKGGSFLHFPQRSLRCTEMPIGGVNVSPPKPPTKAEPSHAKPAAYQLQKILVGEITRPPRHMITRHTGYAVALDTRGERCGAPDSLTYLTMIYSGEHGRFVTAGTSNATISHPRHTL